MENDKSDQKICRFQGLTLAFHMRKFVLLNIQYSTNLYN